MATIDERFDLMVRDLHEVMGSAGKEEALKALLAERQPRIYWGTAPTGKPHLGYFVPVLKLADFLAAGCKVKVLFADLHAHLDNGKTSWELVEARRAWYEVMIKAMLSYVGVSLDSLEFVRGTDYQLSREYTLDVYRLMVKTSTKEGQNAGSEVVKSSEAPPHQQHCLSSAPGA